MQDLESHGTPSEEELGVRFVRKPLEVWDRLKFLALFLVVWVAFVAVSSNNNPLESLSTAARLVSQNEWWLIILIAIELLRQLNYLVLEHSPGWFAYWNSSVVSRFSGIGKDWDDWTRFRVTRVAKVVLVLALLSVVLAAHYHQSPFVALFLAPAALINNLPTILQFALYMVLIIAQFAALFWFMARGGVETYFPGDIKTRFSDVWGQDSVLEKIKENIIFLKDPEIIEERGGYVPGGILLWGPPGTGKTLMAEAVAGETENPFVFVDPGAFTSMFFGIGVLKVKGLFRKLRKLALRYGGVVVFMDEADTLGSRGNMAGVQSQFRSASHGGVFGDLCHGPNYLSASSSEIVTRELLFGGGNSDEPAPRRWSRYVFPGGGMGGGSGSSSFDGTLQALLTELSGLKKPRGFFNRVVRRSLGLPPKSPPKYRMLIMMASNMPESLDQALLRPGRLDRIYKVGYPSKEGRVRTYMGYLSKVQHNLTDAEIDRLATITPYATGATIKDLVNEALINTIRDGREVITWPDVVKAKQLKELGPPEDVEYIHRERHAVAVHEACHAVTAARVRHHLAIDMATIEKGGTYLGMVSSIKPEDQFTNWRSEFEADIMVSLASLAGERLFFQGDNSSGVSGDLEAATVIASLMEAHWGMGSTISSQRASQVLGFGGGGSNQRRSPGGKEGNQPRPRGLDDRVEAKLEELYNDVTRLLEENRAQVLAVAHALEAHKTVTGEDIEAIVEFRKGPIIDGTPYGDPSVQRELEEYHLAAVEAHRNHTNVSFVLPIVGKGQIVDPSRVREIDTQVSVAWNQGDELGGEHE
ncbi:MAG: AAA family ATPase [Acidimicrobiales bacterium]